jgi:hypothetical protein
VIDHLCPDCGQYTDHPGHFYGCWKPLRVLVTGSRDWGDRAKVRGILDYIGGRYGYDGMVVVHGHCPTGADAFADEWAQDNADLGVIVERHPAEWNRHGKRAGFLRNAEMVDLGADVCLAFQNPCTKHPHQAPHASHGADHCSGLADEARIAVRRFGVTWEPIGGKT